MNQLVPVDGLGELEDFSAVAKTVLNSVLPEYRKQVKVYDPWLEQKGRDVVRIAYGKVAQLVLGKVGETANKTPPSPPPSLLDKFMSPVVDPFSAGAEDELSKVVRPVLVGGGIALLLVATGVFLLGRWSK